MAGFRDFQTGEVLTAANVNDFLMQQSVMKFADAAARDTALGTATGGSNALREGMAAYLDDADALQVYDGTSWATVGNAGIGTNVVQSIKTDVFTASLGQGAVSSDVPDLSVSITPTSASSKILVLASVKMDTGNAYLYRDGSVTAYRGDAAGSRQRVASGAGAEASRRSASPAVIMYLDSPATTSSVTYSIRVSTSAATTSTVLVNRGFEDTDNSARARTVSDIMAIEVAA